MGVAAVFFDVGETLVDESRLWRGWANYLGVAAPEFFAALEETIVRGEHHRHVFHRFRPGLDIEAARRERATSGDHDLFSADDLYPDAVLCLRQLKTLGYPVGIAGNQPVGAEAVLTSCGFEADFVASSTSLGVEKPSLEFFLKLAALTGIEISRIAYVGDRLDHDILPARAAGMRTVLIARGPWAKAQAGLAEVGLAEARLRGLTGLPAVLAALS